MNFNDLTIQQSEILNDLKLRIDKVLDHGRYIMGPEVGELEAILSDFVGSKNCITVSSGTEALLISLMGLGIRSGDEVITTPFTFVSTAEVIALLGAKPVFVDIEDDTCNIDVGKIKEKINSRTKAIMPVSLFGQVSDMKEINTIAKEHNLYVIEDAAQSFGATYEKVRSCNLSDVGCTSFFPSKPLGCYGDGGAIFTNDDEIADKFRHLRIHGQNKKYSYNSIGVGGRMDTLQCAILLAKFPRFIEEITSRQKNAQIYNELFDKAGIKRIKVRENRKSVHAQYTIFLENRNKVIENLEIEKIPYAIYYPKPLNSHEPYQKFCCSDCTPISNILSKQVLSLPFGPDINQFEIEKVVKAVLK